MCNKDFHPSSIRNLRKVYEAKEKEKLEARRQEELRLQYLKEQELYQTKELMGKANPLGFMYEPPPGFSKEDRKREEDEEGEPKLKFDWQKKGKAPPRDEIARNKDVNDQPFGVEVRHVKCIKCGKWGHINTDRECPLYGKVKPGTEATTVSHPILTDWDTIDDGLKFKSCAQDRKVDSTNPLHQYVHSDDDDETEIDQLLGQFTAKQRHRILKKLSKAERKDAEKEERRHRKESRHSDHKKRRHKSDEDSDSDSERSHNKRHKKKSMKTSSDRKREHRHHHHRHGSKT